MSQHDYTSIQARLFAIHFAALGEWCPVPTMSGHYTLLVQILSIRSEKVDFPSKLNDNRRRPNSSQCTKVLERTLLNARSKLAPSEYLLYIKPFKTG